MKTKVDPLIVLNGHRRVKAKDELAAAQQRLETLEAEHSCLKEALQAGRDRFEQAQENPLTPAEHGLHQLWLNRMRIQLKKKREEIEAHGQLMDRCRERLSVVHTELKKLEKYKSNLEADLLSARKVREEKELDEIAGQKYRRCTAW